MHSDTINYLELKEEKLENYSSETEEGEKSQHEEPEQEMPFNYARE